jgi:hypothetical protein
MTTRPMTMLKSRGWNCRSLPNCVRRPSFRCRWSRVRRRWAEALGRGEELLVRWCVKWKIGWWWAPRAFAPRQQLSWRHLARDFFPFRNWAPIRPI